MTIAGTRIARPWKTAAPLHGAALREEALKHIDEVVQLVVDSMSEHGERLPEESTDDVQVTVEPCVTVTV
jgi:hypothetical protein